MEGTMNISVLPYLLNGLLMLALPLGLAIYLTRKFKAGWGLWWIGAATFILSQVGHIPFNAGLTRLFQAGVLPSPPADWRLPFNAVVLGLSAGLWEELARYAMYRWWAKDARSWRSGLLAGAGHGGIEAILLGLLVLWGFLQMMALRGVDISTVVPPEQAGLAQQQFDAYWSAPWYAAMLGAVERLFTLPFHIGLSLLVLQVFTRGQSRWLWLAAGWHALGDALGYYTANTWGPYWAEAVIGGLALISLGIIFALRTPEPSPEDSPAPAAPPPPVFVPDQVAETPDNLADTRFQ